MQHPVAHAVPHEPFWSAPQDFRSRSIPAMPIDQQTKQAKPSTTKPITPALSTRFRNAKAPLAPRLAASAPSSPAIAARRDLRTQKSTSTDETQTTPAVDNITPRSGPRKTRLGTASPATPVSSRRSSANTSVQQGLGATSPGTKLGQTRPQTTGATSTGLRRTSGSSSTFKKDEGGTKFFRAGDARALTGSPKSQGQTVTQSRPISFLKSSPKALPTETATSSPNIRKQNDEGNGKFFRANNITDHTTNRLGRPLLTSKLSTLSAPVLSNRSPEVSRSVVTLSPNQSPKKGGPTALYKSVTPPQNALISPTMVALPDSPIDRRNSIGSTMSRINLGGGHKKSASVSVIQNPKPLTSPPLPRLQMFESSWAAANGVQSNRQSTSNMLAASDTTSPRSASMASSKATTVSVTSDTDHSEILKLVFASKDGQIDTSGPAIQLASQATPLSQAQTNAANARRERKVLDLEISNSSLLAINKTLERELKKQSTELRRFRRLSRNGRLSLAPSKRSVSGQSMLSVLTEHAEEDDELDISSSEDESDISDEDEEHSLLEESSFLSNNPSITARARQRARDERRLMLDLSKHQQLLVDSQKMSQSIRKCLNFSEELIKEGKKALEYKVGIGDVKLGGRVLNTDDEGEMNTNPHSFNLGEGDARRGLLSPGLSLTELQEATGWLGVMRPPDHDNVFEEDAPD